MSLAYLAKKLFGIYKKKTPINNEPQCIVYSDALCLKFFWIS